MMSLGNSLQSATASLGGIGEMPQQLFIKGYLPSGCVTFAENGSITWEISPPDSAWTFSIVCQGSPGIRCQFLFRVIKSCRLISGSKACSVLGIKKALQSTLPKTAIGLRYDFTYNRQATTVTRRERIESYE